MSALHPLRTLELVAAILRHSGCLSPLVSAQSAEDYRPRCKPNNIERSVSQVIELSEEPAHRGNREPECSRAEPNPKELGPVSPILLGREQHLRMVPHQTSAFHPLRTLARVAKHRSWAAAI